MTNMLFSNRGGGIIINEQKISKNDFTNDDNTGSGNNAYNATNDYSTDGRTHIL